MTVKGLHKSIFQKDKYHSEDRLHDCIPPGKQYVTAGVDAFMFVVAGVTCQPGAEWYHAQPKARNEAALALFKSRHKLLVSNKISFVVYVFDGSIKEHKKATNDSRTNSKEDKAKELRELLEAGIEASYDTAQKLRKSSARVEEHVIADILEFIKKTPDATAIQAPSEAEEQLVSLEKNGIIDVVISDDGDCMALGAKCQVTSIDWKAKSNPTCCLYKSADVWARSSAGGGCSFEHDICTKKVKEANVANLNDVGGPNESVKSKRQQLEMQERLYKLHQRPEFKECKSIISHYVTAMKGARDRWLKQLNVLDRPKEEWELVDFQMPPTLLTKFPPTMDVLADRGFASCAVYYPNKNAMVTPFFLDGRSQFTSEEVGTDRQKCKLRYASEAVFSRVWLFGAVRDKVPRELMYQLWYFVNYAHGMANLCKPFYKPGRDGYFEKDGNASLDMGRHHNYAEFVVPKEYIEAKMEKCAILKDGKDFATDTIWVNPVVTRAQYSDKMKCSAARIITWALPTGLVVEHTGLYMGRAPETRLVELWGNKVENL